MNTLIKLAVGAAIAGALVNLAMKQRSRKSGRNLLPMTAGRGRVPSGSGGFTLEEIAGENAEWGGGSSGLNA
ncbi:MAG TPA: hypothetical protein VM146_16505 [Steroidobacteraceae bacterium]|nr:hypothetical protein [Steroidobacteraceae bacterium]